jgi:hypothetical protein
MIGWIGKPQGKRQLGRPRHSWVWNLEEYDEIVCTDLIRPKMRTGGGLL